MVNLPSDYYKHKIEDVVKMCEVDMIIGNKKDFSTANIQQALNSLLKDTFMHMIEESDMDLALSAVNAGMEYLQLIQGKQKQFALKKYTLNEYLRLDVAALKAMNVFPSSIESSSLGGAAASLFGLLNMCKTQIGSRLLKKWLK